eukprot:COSAG05_NODE_12170_length_480_cov_0.816273_1_plen_26_part_10
MDTITSENIPKTSGDGVKRPLLRNQP